MELIGFISSYKTSERKQATAKKASPIKKTKHAGTRRPALPGDSERVLEYKEVCVVPSEMKLVPAEELAARPVHRR